MTLIGVLSKEALQECLNNNLNVKEMAEKFDCSEVTIRTYIKNYELKIILNRYINLDIKELYKLRVDYMWTHKELAELYKVSYTTIMNRCREFEFPNVNAGRQNNSWRLKPLVNKRRKEVNKNASKLLKELYDLL